MTGPLDRLDASQYGDPEGERPADVGPPCEVCGDQEATTDLGDVPLCRDCADDVDAGWSA